MSTRLNYHELGSRVVYNPKETPCLTGIYKAVSRGCTAMAVASFLNKAFSDAVQAVQALDG
jgi:hypothetical protein